MRLKINLAIALLIAVILFIPGKSFGVKVKIIDQAGAPVENAVVSVKQPSKTRNDSAKLDNVIMDQVNSQFDPHVLIVEKKQQVIFPNSDDIRHHIYSFSKPNDFEIKMYRGGEKKSLQFEQSGIVVLGCNIHDQMRGYLYIADQEETAITDENGIAVIDTSAPKMTIWHSGLSTNHIARKTVNLASDNQQTQIFTLRLLTPQKSKIKRKFGSKFKKSSN